MHYANVYGPDGQFLDDVIASVFRAPRSYTGEDSVEISCHASIYIVSSVMQMLGALGARPADPGEFTRRAFVNGKMDLAQAEAVADVIGSSSSASHRIAVNQMRGGFSAELQDMRSKLLEITSLMELELDFSEEDVEFADRKRLLVLLDSSIESLDRLVSSFKLGNALKNGVPVAIVGAANAGKSTLLNALISEERAIVTDVPGTTRDTVEETFIMGGIQFRFIDTAGIRETSDAVEIIGIDRSFSTLEKADVVIVTVDITSSMELMDESLNALMEHVDLNNQTVLFALNKTDLSPTADSRSSVSPQACSFAPYTTAESSVLTPGRGQASASDLQPYDTAAESIVRKHCSDAQVIRISAFTGAGLDALRQALTDSQKKRFNDAGQTLVSNTRHFNSLCATAASLNLVRSGLLSHTPTDLVAHDLREALYHLGTITGNITTDEVLGNIFKNFCIGK